MNKKGVSAVVATVILIVVTIMAASIIWVMVQNLIDRQTHQSESCLMSFKEMKIDPKYTCYDSPNSKLVFLLDRTSERNQTQSERFEAVQIEIVGENSTFAFTILNNNSIVGDFLKNAENTENVITPDFNSAKKYFFYPLRVSNQSIGKIKSIAIAPIIASQKCAVIDSLNQIPEC